MRILYIDESHSKDYYVLAGVLINDTAYNNIERQFDKLLEGFGMTRDDELKAYSMFSRSEGIWKDKDLCEIIICVESIIDFLSKNKLSLFLGGLNTTKENDHDKYPLILKNIIQSAAKKTSQDSGNTKKHLMIVVDEREDLRKEGSVYKAVAERKEAITKIKNITCKIFDYGFEGISKYSRFLQIADFSAYLYRTYLEINNRTDERKKSLLREAFKTKLKNKIKIVKDDFKQ